MNEYHLRATFYGRKEFVDLRCTESEYAHFHRCAMRLAAGHKDIPSHFLLSLSETIKALVAIKEIQALYFMDCGRQFDSIEVLDGRELMDRPGLSLYLKQRAEPITLHMSRKGPIYDMIGGLVQVDYTDESVQCVMLQDDRDCAFFFVLEEIQYAVISAELIQPE